MKNVYVTITWGAAASTATVATIVNNVNTIKQSLSSTMAANFQSFSIAALSSSSRILSVIILISFRIKLSSLETITKLNNCFLLLRGWICFNSLFSYILNNVLDSSTKQTQKQKFKLNFKQFWFYFELSATSLP